MAAFGRFLGGLIGVALVLALLFFVFEILRFMWVAGSSPNLAGRIVVHFFEASWLQAIATILISVATVALWVATLRLSGVTAVQVHAQTAPLIAVLAYVVTDPPQPGTEQMYPLPPYEFTTDDAGNVEMNAFHRQFDLLKQQYDDAVAQAQQRNESGGLAPLPILPPPRKTFLAVRIFNTQASSSYGFATDFDLSIVLKFPRISTIQGAGPATIPQADHFYELPRTLKFPMIFGQNNVVIGAFRVDQMPYWSFKIDSVTYRNFRGKPCTFAVGTGGGAFDGKSGFTTDNRRWDPSPREQPG